MLIGLFLSKETYFSPREFFIESVVKKSLTNRQRLKFDFHFPFFSPAVRMLDKQQNIKIKYSLYKETRMGGFDVIKIPFLFKLTSAFTERKKFPEKDAVSKIEKRCGKFFNFFFFLSGFKLHEKEKKFIFHSRQSTSSR